jgi:heme exporter protein B
MHLNASLRKEAMLQWRGRAHFVSVFAFGAAALLIFSFGIGPDSAALRLYASGFLWIALLLASTLTLAESFRVETEQRGMEGMLLLPMSDAAFFYGKALANWLELFVLGAALTPIMVILYDAGTREIPMLLAVIALGTAGLAAPGTMYAAMSAGARARQILLPLLLFPLVVPALLASVKATSLVILGDPMGQLSSWLILLICFDVIYWSICGLLFGQVVEE